MKEPTTSAAVVPAATIEARLGKRSERASSVSA